MNITNFKNRNLFFPIKLLQMVTQNIPTHNKYRVKLEILITLKFINFFSYKTITNDNTKCSNTK